MNTINQHNSPAFGAYYKSSFSRHLEHTLRTGEKTNQVIDEFTQILKNKKNISTKIGQGKYGEVFRIDDFYVFKSYFNQEPNPNTFKPATDDTFKNLKTYFGQVIAKIGNIEIIRNVTKNTKNFVQMANGSKEGIQALKQSLREFESLPQEAFDRLAHDFNELNKIRKGNMFFRFDTNNPNNFIKVGRQIRVVDEIAWTPCQKPNTLYGMLRIFLQENADINLAKQLFKKCALACEKYELPIDDDYKYLKNYMDTLFKNASINTNFEKYYQKITELRLTQENKTTRLKMINDYLDSLIS